MLRAMVADPGHPGVMASLGRSTLARLLSRRGEHDAAREILGPALEQVASSDDSFLVGPVTVAQVELGWLDGSLGEMTDAARRALDLAAATGHRSVQAELWAYLCRAGIRVPRPPNPPGPWGPTLAGRWK